MRAKKSTKEETSGWIEMNIILNLFRTSTSRIHLADTTQVSYVSTCCNFVFIYWKREMNEWKQNNLGNTDTVHVYCIQYLITILMICLTPSILNRAYALILYRSDQIPPKPNVSPEEPPPNLWSLKIVQKEWYGLIDCMSVNISFCNSSLETSGHTDDKT